MKMSAFAIVTLALALVVGFAYGEHNTYSVPIDESGTDFNEKIYIDEEKNIAIFDVPAHNNLDAVKILIDSTRGVSVTKVRKLKTCFMEKLPKDTETPKQLRVALDKTHSRFPWSRYMVTRENLVIKGTVQDRKALGLTIGKLCDGLDIKILRKENFKQIKGEYQQHLKAVVKRPRSKRYVFPPGRALPDACDEAYTSNQLQLCYGKGKFTFNLKCKVATRNCYYKMGCNVISVANNQRTWDCKGVHQYRNLVCCDMVCA